MNRRTLHSVVARTGLLALTVLPACARAQASSGPGSTGEWQRDPGRQAIVRDTIDSTAAGITVSSNVAAVTKMNFKNRADSVAWARYKRVAERASGFRVVVSLQDRMVFAIAGQDTVLKAPAAVARGNTVEYGKRKWTFETPRGRRTVLSKEADPIWQPPDWLYAETALEHGLKLGPTIPSRGIKLKDGRLLTVRDGMAGVVEDGVFGALPVEEHIVFYGVLYIPPLGSANRKVEGELGKFRLNLGEGYLLHGTPHKQSIGLAATHGCIRMRDDDIEWLYENIPVGTPVYIY